jgi:asparagine synthase (glutamine-hydrolysing)
MCGFAGILNAQQVISEQELGKIALMVRFRGPDHTGVAVYDEAFARTSSGCHGFFFNRLAIIDLDKRSNQPFEDARYSLLFNGEIYNYQELKQELKNEGVSFITASDTEVLFNGLIRYGKRFIERLNGMFSFAFVDRKEQRFLLARDRTGIKPLCYSFKNNSLIFGSEADSIVRLMPEIPDISAKAASLYLAFQYVPTPYTIWEGIEKLPPGHYLEGSIDELKAGALPSPVAWWTVESATQKPAVGQDLETMLVSSIRSQLQADVPLGLFLSSGVDSSLLAAVINRHFRNEQKFNFFTVAFDTATASDESADAERYLAGFGNPDFSHHKLYVNPKALQESVAQMYEYIDEPFGDPAVLLNYGISQKAREQVTVALSGDGADELFWGYSRYNRWTTNLSRWTRLPLFQPFRPLLKLFPEHISQQLFRITERNPLYVYLNMITSRFGRPEDILRSECWGLENSASLLQREDLPSAIDVKNYLPDCMFFKVDRASMGTSLEVRVPYLDNAVIDYGLSLPLSGKSTSRFGSKAPIKELLLKLAPHYNIAQPKKGFNFPLKEWISTEWKDLFYSVICANNLDSVGLSRKLLGLLDRHYYRHQDYTYELWYLFNLLHWKESKYKYLKNS